MHCNTIHEHSRRLHLFLALVATLIISVAYGCANAKEPPVAPVSTTITATSAEVTKPSSAKFKISLEGLDSCLSAKVTRLELGTASDKIYIEITRRADFSTCDCVFPKQTWLPATFLDATGALIYGVDLTIPEELGTPSTQRFDLYHSKFNGYDAPYQISIQCETEFPPG
jgi:hypothetical protein